MKRVSLEILRLYFVFSPFLFRLKRNTKMLWEGGGKQLWSIPALTLERIFSQAKSFQFCAPATFPLEQKSETQFLFV